MTTWQNGATALICFWRKENSAMKLDTTNTHPDMDYDAHQATYAGFIRLVIIGIVFLVLLLATMAFFLV